MAADHRPLITDHCPPHSPFPPFAPVPVRRGQKTPLAAQFPPKPASLNSLRKTDNPNVKRPSAPCNRLDEACNRPDEACHRLDGGCDRPNGGRNRLHGPGERPDALPKRLREVDERLPEPGERPNVRRERLRAPPKRLCAGENGLTSALTLTLSPRRGNSFGVALTICPTVPRIQSSGIRPQRKPFLPLLEGEGRGVRASVPSNSFLFVSSLSGFFGSTPEKSANQTQKDN